MPTVCVVPCDYWIEGQDCVNQQERVCRFLQALAIAQAQQEKGNAVFIFCGGGTPWKHGRDHLPPLAQTTADWFVKHGWPQAQLIVNGKGFDTITEAHAVNEKLPRQPMRIIVVSSWYHIVRVWFIWLLAFHRCVTIRASTSVLPWTRAVWWEMKATIPSLGLAVLWGIGFKDFVQRRIEKRFTPV